jgi:hypothetical protein
MFRVEVVVVIEKRSVDSVYSSGRSGGQSDSW